MPIDYSKWDKLELSDDDDFECHPNVDKASFIRWKQADIHAKREERRRKIGSLKQKISQDDVLLDRIDTMIQKLQSEGVESFFKTIEELRETNKEMESEAIKTESTPQGEGTEPTPPTFDQMMRILFEKIQQEVKNESPEEVSERLIDKLKEHREKLKKSQDDAKVELEKEENEARKKIIVDDLHTGFDKAVFIKNYNDSFTFISKHPEIVTQEVVDQILAEAFRAQLKGKAKYAKQCVHQGWITSTDPQARDIFLKDVSETYERIRERCKVMNAEKTQKPQQSQAEQIQIEVTDPNSSLNVHIPDEHSEDEKEKEKYQIFLTLPEDFREALKTGELVKINKVLGGFTVEEAEKILEICGRAEVLSIEEGIIDATKGETIPGQNVDSKTSVDDQQLSDQTS
ncbi:425_t:CDS:2 [Acaulospora colombiana]|uniref:425_t:CDS:1 n=1 Tax=Acaulospora colombiana TaxID=27376 RepID=A0ACA9LTV3_9GLOM|nr:425_t:CDS:2 [Acaulospora colombiana]